MIGVVVNPNALGVRRRPGLARRLRSIVGSYGRVIETRTPDDVRAAVEEFRDAGASVLGTCGGDGTNLSTITEAVRIFGERVPTVAILRGGTVNTVAENLEVAGEPEEIASRLVRWVARAEEVPCRGQDLLHVNGMYGFLFAAAMGARFLEAYYGGPRPGLAWAGLLWARTVASSAVHGPFARWLFSPTEVELEIDGVRAAGPSRPKLLVASTVPDVGMGMKVAWQAGRQPARFHLVASGLSTPQMALQLHKVLRGRPLEGTPHLDVLAKRARIRFPAPETYTLDGDLFRDTTVEIAVGPRIWIARP
jgi:diacylglycerol kinase family enzyme